MTTNFSFIGMEVFFRVILIAVLHESRIRYIKPSKMHVGYNIEESDDSCDEWNDSDLLIPDNNILYI